MQEQIRCVVCFSRSAQSLHRGEDSTVALKFMIRHVAQFPAASDAAKLRHTSFGLKCRNLCKHKSPCWRIAERQ
jgi:hypothetical protein